MNVIKRKIKAWSSVIGYLLIDHAMQTQRAGPMVSNWVNLIAAQRWWFVLSCYLFFI